MGKDSDRTTVALEVDAQSMEGDALLLQAQSLLQAVVSGKQDAPSGAEDALPGQSAGGVQRPRHLARGPGVSSRISDIAIGGHAAARNARHHAQHAIEHPGGLLSLGHGSPFYEDGRRARRPQTERSRASGFLLCTLVGGVG